MDMFNKGGFMNQRNKLFKQVLMMNLIIGIYNIVCYSIYGYKSALVIGIINVGVWAFIKEISIAKPNK